MYCQLQAEEPATDDKESGVFKARIRVRGGVSEAPVIKEVAAIRHVAPARNTQVSFILFYILKVSRTIKHGGVDFNSMALGLW